MSNMSVVVKIRDIFAMLLVKTYSRKKLSG